MRSGLPVRLASTDAGLRIDLDIPARTALPAANFELNDVIIAQIPV